MKINSIKNKLSDLASIIGIITGVTMFVLYIGSMQHRITTVENVQEDFVKKDEFVLIIKAINDKTDAIDRKTDLMDLNYKKIHEQDNLRFNSLEIQMGIINKTQEQTNIINSTINSEITDYFNKYFEFNKYKYNKQ